jgi:hypothetical protein
MKFFCNRKDTKYIKCLLNTLDIKRLIDTAIELPPNSDKAIQGYTKCIQIDFCGVSASTLLNQKKVIDIYNAFINVLENKIKFEENNIFLKIRFIFSYLYSDFSYSLIGAELTPNRATINEPTYTSSFNNDIELSKTDLYESNSYRNQSIALNKINHLKNKYQIGAGNKHSITIRFATIPLNICSLVINNECYSDPYLYSRLDRASTGLTNDYYPVLFCDKLNDKNIYNCVVDNFRYIWNHQQTIYYKDAYIEDPSGRIKILEPENIKYSNKGSGLANIEKGITSNLVSQEQIAKHTLFLAKNLKNLSRTYVRAEKEISIFIACSWEINSKTNKNQPNKHATDLQKQINQDFGNIFTPVLVVTPPGGDVFSEIETSLQNSTLGIIIITKDIKSADGKFYTRPNVYYEYGYLRRSLDQKVLALVQNGATPPSNTNNKGYHTFENDLLFEYLHILKWILRNYDYISLDTVIRAVYAHIARLEIHKNSATLNDICIGLIEDAKDFLIDCEKLKSRIMD